MKVLLVNNDSDTWKELVDVTKVAGYDVARIHYSAIGAIDPRGYDLAILSGGWWAPDQDQSEVLKVYAEEIRFIEENHIPILGICVGMLLMHVAVNQAVPLLDERQYGVKEITVNDAGQAKFGFPAKINVFKNHDRAVIETDPQFEILAFSPGHTEMMQHRTKSLLGVQFHPEVGDINEGAALLKTLVEGLLKLPQK